VQTARLDELLSASDLQEPVLLKIDAQGGELGVLAGASGVLAAISTVLVECSFAELYEGQPTADAVIRFLHDHGFTLHSVGAVTSAPDGRPIQADFVLGRTDLTALGEPSGPLAQEGEQQ